MQLAAGLTFRQEDDLPGWAVVDPLVAVVVVVAVVVDGLGGGFFRRACSAADEK